MVGTTVFAEDGKRGGEASSANVNSYHKSALSLVLIGSKLPGSRA